MAGQAAERHDGVAGAHEGAVALFGTARRAGKAEDLQVELRGGEIAFVRDADLAGFRVAADVAGGEPVDVVENARSGDGGCPANAFLGGLEDELHLAAEGLLVVGEPLRDAKAHGRVAVVPAGVGEAGTRGGEALAVGQMVFVLRLLDGEAVDVEAKRGDGTGTARVEHADAARVAAHALEEGFGDACGAGELNGGLDLFGLAGHDGVGIDHLKAVVSNSSQPCSGFMWKLRRSSTMRSTYCSVCAVMLMSLRPRFTRIIKLNRF